MTMPKASRLDPAAAARLIHPRDSVIAGFAAGQPVGFLEALGERTDLEDVVLYDIRENDRTFIPGSRHLRRGPGGSVQIVQPEGSVPAWRAMYDPRNRMVVAVNFNTDVADAWEFADVPYYPEAMTTLAYRYGINYIIYSMTH